MKKLGFIAIAFFMILSMNLFLSCGQGQGTTTTASSSQKLVVWSFTDELGGMIEEFKKVYPNVEIEFTVFPNDDEIYLNRINNTMRSRSQTPDVFTGERAWFRQVIEAGFWEPLSGAPYNAENLMANLVDYVPDLSRDSEGRITALSWQATPGGLFYRRSIARDVLGTDDPAVVSQWTSDINKFYELGEKIREYYGGQKFLLSGFSDMSEFVFNRRTEPYVQGNRVIIPATLVEYMQLAKRMRDNRVEAGAGTWSPPWFSSMTDGSVFAYILPTWGLHYVLKPNAEPEAHAGTQPYSGDWGLASPPAPYSWGGTWIGINRNSVQKDLAWQFVEFIGSNPQFQETWARSTGDFVSNTQVIDRIKGDFTEPFLGGQNHYAYFADQVNQIDVSFIGPWDFQIQNAWGDQVDLYANGQKTLDQAINDFRLAVLDIIPNISEVVVRR